MKTSLILAVVSALPLLAQEPAPQQETPAAPQGEQAPSQGMHRNRGHHMQGPRGQHRGMMNPEQQKQMLEKFDADKDGKLSEEERKAMREEFMKNRPQMPGRPGAQGQHGPRRGMMDPEQQKQMLEKFDADKDGKLSEEERKAAREEFMKNRPQMPGRPGAQGPQGPRRGMMDPERQKQMLEKFDTDKDGKLSEEEHKAMREEFMKNRPQGPRGPRGHHGPQGRQQGEQPQAPAQPAPQE